MKLLTARLLIAIGSFTLIPFSSAVAAKSKKCVKPKVGTNLPSCYTHRDKRLIVDSRGRPVALLEQFCPSGKSYGCVYRDADTKKRVAIRKGSFDRYKWSFKPESYLTDKKFLKNNKVAPTRSKLYYGKGGAPKWDFKKSAKSSVAGANTKSKGPSLKSLTSDQRAELNEMIQAGETSKGEIQKKAREMYKRNNPVHVGGDAGERDVAQPNLKQLEKEVGDQWEGKRKELRNVRDESERKKMRGVDKEMADLMRRKRDIKTNDDVLSNMKKQGLVPGELDSYDDMSKPGNAKCNRLISALRQLKTTHKGNPGMNNHRSSFDKALPALNNPTRQQLFKKAYKSNQRGFFISSNCLNHGKCNSTCSAKKVKSGAQGADQKFGGCVPVAASKSNNSGADACASGNKGVSGIFVPESVAKAALGLPTTEDGMSNDKGETNLNQYDMKENPFEWRRTQIAKAKADAKAEGYDWADVKEEKMNEINTEMKRLMEARRKAIGGNSTARRSSSQ